MININISPSKIDSYLAWKNDWYGEKDEKELIGTIKGESIIDINVTKYGSAMHDILEHGANTFKKDNSFVYVPVKGLKNPLKIDVDTALFLNKLRSSFKNLVHEVSFNYPIKVKGYNINLRGRCDGVEGVILHEHKFTKNANDVFNRFSKSCQWKVYLLASGAEMLRYNIFKWSIDKEEKIKIELMEPIKMFPYKQMLNDIVSDIYMFIEYCESRGLIEHLKDKEWL